MRTWLDENFFDRDAMVVAKDLLGKVLRHKVAGMWLSAQIIEAEAYYLAEKASHSSLGYSESRKALFMPAGTIYMYYARGQDSFNTCCKGEGNAVLFKAGIPYVDDLSENAKNRMIKQMQEYNPVINLKTGEKRIRPANKLCSGQTLLCRSLKVPRWRAKPYDPTQLRLEDTGYRPADIIQTSRLGIPKGRDEHLPYRFIDKRYAKDCTQNPLLVKRK